MHGRSVSEEILELVTLGKLHVDHETLTVSVYHGGHRRWIEKKPDQHPISGRYRFRFGKQRRTVYRNKVVWIYFKRSIPEDSQWIDHIDEDNQNDRIQNLQLHSVIEGCVQGAERQADLELENWRALLDYIEFMGEPPPEDSILWT